MKQFTLKVTQADIDNGTTEHGKDAVSLALKRKFRNKNADIGFRMARNRKDIYEGTIEVENYIRKILRKEKVEPAEFIFTEYI